MPTTDQRVDAYIAKAPEYARPILNRIREWVHEGAPACEETLKWNSPTFVQNGILCGMAAFKQHCIVGFWKGSLVGANIRDKLTSVDDLPPKPDFLRSVRRAVELNESGVKVVRAPAKPKKPLAMPADFRRALARSAKARATWQSFSPSHQREYLEWILDAKQEETRSRRIGQAVEWISEGKPRNWKYLKK
jgi:uncharacterized protein YdeI (YjbR/CyaY-like superfamily)